MGMMCVAPQVARPTPVPARPTISPAHDPAEQEASRIADRVMRGGSAWVGALPAGVTLAGKCSECPLENETRTGAQCKANSNVDAGASAQLAPRAVTEVLRAPGHPLEAATRGFFEPRFGHDFGSVRVHSDAQAAESARAVDALAYTVGRNIVFDTGLYRPGEPAGRALLAHELTHVVQQRAAPERVQRFGSEEHVKIGERVEPGQTIDLGPDVGKATYGEMIALGDYFESVSQILIEANDPMFGAQEVKVALWKVNPAARSRPFVGQDVENAVMARYYDLAAKNQTHFSKGSQPGMSNREQFIAMHQTAISNAYTQGANRIIHGISWEGWEGFAEHFLTDAFSAGHVRTPRHEIQAYWNGKYPKFTDNLVDMICCYMASYINDRDNVGYVKTVGGLAEGIKPILIQTAGPALNAFKFGDLISKALHDADSMGLEVRSKSPAGPGKGPKHRVEKRDRQRSHRHGKGSVVELVSMERDEREHRQRRKGGEAHVPAVRASRRALATHLLMPNLADAGPILEIRQKLRI